MNLLQYILRRTLYAIPVLLGVCLIIFLIFNVFFGDPTALLLGKHANAEQMHELREQLGLNKSLIAQYFDVVKSAFTFDFGRSWATKQQISHMFANGAILITDGESTWFSYFNNTGYYYFIICLSFSRQDSGHCCSDYLYSDDEFI